MSDGTTRAPLFPKSVSAFPNNIVIALKNQIEGYYPDFPVFLRPIRQGDPITAWSVTAGEWMPNEDSWEMIGSTPLMSPTLNRYTIGIQSFNQSMDSEEGLQVAASMAGFLRTMLSRDPGCRVALQSLTSVEFGFTETVRRFQIQGQRFVSGEISGQFLFLTNLEFVVETETR